MWKLNKVYDMSVQFVGDKENKMSGSELIEIFYKG